MGKMTLAATVAEPCKGGRLMLLTVFKAFPGEGVVVCCLHMRRSCSHFSPELVSCRRGYLFLIIIFLSQTWELAGSPLGARGERQSLGGNLALNMYLGV